MKGRFIGGFLLFPQKKAKKFPAKILDFFVSFFYQEKNENKAFYFLNIIF